MNRHLTAILTFAALACALTLTAGCNDKDDPAGPPPPEYTLPFPDTPQQLMANFRTALTELDLAAYRDEVLAGEYEFILQQSTQEDFGLPDNILDRTDELEIARKMFTGQPNSRNQVISSIEVASMQPTTAWLPVPETDADFGDVPDALVCSYYFRIYFNMRSDLRYEVTGAQHFYVVPSTQMLGGVMTPCYRLRGQVDQSSAYKSTESQSWGSVKALYL